MEAEESVALKSSVESCLKLMNESLICPICKDAYVTPVIINICSHNFCSICIRRYFTIKQECPLCGLEASTANLTPNRIVETMIKHFENLRSVLKNVIEKPCFLDHMQVIRNATASSAVGMEIGEKIDFTKSSESLDTNPASSSAAEEPIEATPKFSLGLKEFSTQSQGFSTFTNISEKSRTVVSSSHHNKNSNLSDQAMEIVPVSTTQSLQPTSADCPVCGITVDTAVINTHLDGCLAREEKKNSLRKNTPKRANRNKPPTSKLAYNLLPLRELRKKLKEIGLPANGDKNELKRRHQEFLVKYQAEMDKTEPRTVSAVIDELKREETKRKEMEKKTNFLGKLSPTKSNDSEKENMEHLRNHAKEYESLRKIVEKSLPKKRRKMRTERKLFEMELESATSNEVIPGRPNSEDIAPDSLPSCSDDGLIVGKYSAWTDDYSGSSPELYVDEPSSSKIAPTSLREKVEADSQADKIRDYIDASLSEAY